MTTDNSENIFQPGTRLERLIASRKKYYSEHHDNKRQKTFEEYYGDLIQFLQEKGRFPDLHENEDLYRWMSRMSHEARKGFVSEEHISRLNSINFIWDRREYNWFKKADEIRSLVAEQRRPLVSSQQPELYRWLKLHNEMIERGELVGEKKVRIEEINQLLYELEVEALKNIPQKAVKNIPEKVSAREIKWRDKFGKLVKFREENPHRWPGSKVTNEEEHPLGVWCQDLRHRYRKGILEDHWINALKEIKFNFNGQIDNWRQKFDEIKSHCDNTGQDLEREHPLYGWYRSQWEVYDNLDEEKQTLLRFVGTLPDKLASWEKRYNQLEEFVATHGRLPTRKLNSSLKTWIHLQVKRFREGNLSEAEMDKLVSQGVKFGEGESIEAKWNRKYQEFIAFMKGRAKYPSYFGSEAEKQLYIWVQAQRQAYKGTSANKLNSDRLRKLKRIGFIWSPREEKR